MTHRALAFLRIASAQIGAALRDEGVRTFAEAVGFARSKDSDIANVQHRAGLMAEAAATFEVALSAVARLRTNDRGTDLVAPPRSLRLRLLEAAEALTERVGRAEMLSIIARALPN